MSLKKLLVVVSLSIVFATSFRPSFAQTSTMLAKIADTLNIIAQTAVQLVTAGQRAQELTREKREITSKVETWASLNQAHNVHRCMAPADNSGQCAAYNAEAARLSAEAANLRNGVAELAGEEAANHALTAKLKLQLRTNLARLRTLRFGNRDSFEAWVQRVDACTERTTPEAVVACINRLRANISTIADCEARARAVDDWEQTRSAIIADASRLQGLKYSLERQAQAFDASGNVAQTVRRDYRAIEEALDDLERAVDLLPDGIADLDSVKAVIGQVVKGDSGLVTLTAWGYTEIELVRERQGTAGTVGDLQLIRALAGKLSADANALQNATARLRAIRACNSINLV